jgi:dsRNA-specific ribonuclease
MNIAGGNLPSKTPVSVLQELLSRRGTTPKYELVQIEGAIHEPTFRYRVTVGEVIGKETIPRTSRIFIASI